MRRGVFKTCGNAACGMRSEVAPSLTLPRTAGEGTRKGCGIRTKSPLCSYFAVFAPLRELS